jgi:Protein of unknown function (DUF1579)
MKKTLVACAVSLSCAPSMLLAQPPAPAAPPAADAAPAPPAPALPKPGPEVQKLGFLVGDWIHEETFHPSPMGPGGSGKGRSKSVWALGDHHVYTIYTTNSPYGKLEARALFGWDAEKKAYRLSWFDNMGMMTMYHGDFDAEGALAMSAEYSIQGNAVKERLTIRKQADGNVVFSSAMAGPEGAWKPMLDSVATPDAKK